MNLVDRQLVPFSRGSQDFYLHGIDPSVEHGGLHRVSATFRSVMKCGWSIIIFVKFTKLLMDIQKHLTGGATCNILWCTHFWHYTYLHISASYAINNIIFNVALICANDNEIYYAKYLKIDRLTAPEIQDSLD